MSHPFEPSRFDRSTFEAAPFAQRIEKPWGYELLFTEPGLPYAGKILHLDAGRRISLQAHDEKQETQMLVSGRCARIADDRSGTLTETEMVPYQGYTVMRGQRHRLVAITDCDIFEVSTPELGVTWRLSDDYARPDETEDMRNQQRASLPSSS
ncbi:MAG: cupin [Proteobacteria bacterium]|nr:cupin [Pseudomonadota bacterium]